MKGRKPKPAEVKRREGNPGHREIGDPIIVGERLGMEDAEVVDGELVGTELELVAQIPELPEHLALHDELNDDDEARRLWTEVCTVLVEANIIVSGDVFVLETLVEAIMLKREAWEELQRARAEGRASLLVETANDRGGRAAIKPSPYLKVHRDATAIMLKVAEQYGLTPVARARLGLAVGKGKKIWEELEAGLPKNPVERDGDKQDKTVDTDGKGTDGDKPPSTRRKNGAGRSTKRRGASAKSRKK